MDAYDKIYDVIHAFIMPPSLECSDSVVIQPSAVSAHGVIYDCRHCGQRFHKQHAATRGYFPGDRIAVRCKNPHRKR